MVSPTRDIRSGWIGTPVVLLCLTLAVAWPAAAQERLVPHNQDRPPNDPLTPEQAVARMEVPEGFSVEVVAAEPDLVNPVGFTFDERGRIWVLESLEYPRMDPGPGRDRIKVLEDTDGDGRVDRSTIFADGLNIPSGIAVGRGGVWVANSPDILLMHDDDGDLKADRQEVIVTGFGRDDTHELPNSFHWGPDGWLYGYNGVFNRSRIEQHGKVFQFTCALFRIHPETHEFQLFAEGTSNPWGLAFDAEGSAFASACVIDHLWHLTESGYYHRQAGAYPPHTWKIESIVEHRHFKAAYCGLVYFDSPAYPQEYRQRLFMGNIHSNQLVSDQLQRRGSTYFGTKAPDFLSANDAWFMPVSQKVGPDGCLYLLDWYDRYHCYQDARRDPEGIDRLKGRLYRVRYDQTPRRFGFNLAEQTDDQLIDRLAHPNIYDRDTAQRLLIERMTPELAAKLEAVVLDEGIESKGRRHALWTLISAGPLDPAFHQAVLGYPDRVLRAWAVRAAGNQSVVDSSIRAKILDLADDPEPTVALQVAIASTKIGEIDPLPTLIEVLTTHADDRLIPRIVWANLHPLLDERAGELVDRLGQAETEIRDAFAPLLPRLLDRLSEPEALIGLIALTLDNSFAEPELTRSTLVRLAEQIRQRELPPAMNDRIGQELLPRVLNRDDLGIEATLFAASLGDGESLDQMASLALDNTRQTDRRLDALATLIFTDGSDVGEVARQLLDRSSSYGNGLNMQDRARLLAILGRSEAPELASILLELYPRMERELQPKAIVLLTQRPSWSMALLEAIAARRIPTAALNAGQVRSLQASSDPQLVQRSREILGVVREGRDPARDQVVRRMSGILNRIDGDAQRGLLAYQKVCAQCHQFQGMGQNVGPELTDLGQGDRSTLLSHVFDPNLVIGPGYRSTIVATLDGRILNGLLAEDSRQRVTLVLQGGQRVTVARADIDEMKIQDLSLMPEGLESQLTDAEWADLFEFLARPESP